MHRIVASRPSNGWGHRIASRPIEVRRRAMGLVPYFDEKFRLKIAEQPSHPLFVLNAMFVRPSDFALAQRLYDDLLGLPLGL